MAFGFYKAVTIQTGQVPSSQSGFPALVPFLAGDADFATVANGGKAQSANGYDIRPYADSALTTPLTFELVPGSYNASTGAFEMWVNMTAADAAVVYMAVGDSGITTDGSSTATWPTSYKAIHHLPNGSTLTLGDSTSNANALTNTNSVTAIAGQIAGGAESNGSSSYLTSTGDLGVAGGAASTVEMWIKEKSGGGALKGFFGWERGSAEVVIAYFDGTRNGFLIANSIGSHKPSSSVTITNWNHLAIVNDGTHAPTLYVNGALNDTNDGALLSGWISTGYDLGRGVNTSFYANADMDEVRFSNTNRSANWIAIAYNNQSNLSTFWSKGSLIPVGGGGSIIVPVFLLMTQQGWGQP